MWNFSVAGGSGRTVPHTPPPRKREQTTTKHQPGIELEGPVARRRSFSHEPDPTGPVGFFPPFRSPTHVPAESNSLAGTRGPRAPATWPFLPPRPHGSTRGPASRAAQQQPRRLGRKPPPPRRKRTPGSWAGPGRQPIGGRRPTSLTSIGHAGEKAVLAGGSTPGRGRRRDENAQAVPRAPPVSRASD